MTPLELRTALALAAAFFLRMLGLFMVVPVLALYADHLAGATTFLVGLALGLYGLTQALFQIPMGRWSDRIGRKPVITLGLTIFTLGGLVAASAAHILAVVAGRALQGAGAVSGATLALAADLTRPEHRTTTMAIIGVSIGVAFSLAFVIGPMIDAQFGLRGVFVGGALCGLGALGLILFAVPEAPTPRPREAGAISTAPAAELGTLYLGVLCLHLVLAASFVSIPVVLAHDLGLPKAQHYTIYIPVMLISMLCVGPLIGRSSRLSFAARLFPTAIGCIGIAELLLWCTPPNRYAVGAVLTLFFIGFNFLEASLPSRISRAAPASGTGGALGAYSTGQFVGTFIGGVSGGAVAQVFGTHGVFAAASALSLAWLLLTLRTPISDAAAENSLSAHG